MNGKEIKAQRIRLGLTQKDVANALSLKVDTYRKKENGKSPFTEDEKILLAKILQFTPCQMNDFLFGGKLPIGYS